MVFRCRVFNVTHGCREASVDSGSQCQISSRKVTMPLFLNAATTFFGVVASRNDCTHTMLLLRPFPAKVDLTSL